MDPLQLASITGDFLTVLLSMESSTDLCSVLRPDNVLIVQNEIKLKELLPKEAFVPVSGFAAPEQYVAGNCERAPVYFVGALMYTLLYGKPPVDVRLRLSEGQDLALSTTVLTPVITRCLALYPGDRYADLRHILRDLNTILENADIEEKAKKDAIEKENKQQQNAILLKEKENNNFEKIENNINENTNEKIEENIAKIENIEEIKHDYEIENTEESKKKAWGANRRRRGRIFIIVGIVACVVLAYTLWQGQRAESALESGRYDEVINSMTFAPWLRITRDDAYVYAKAQLLWEQGNYDEAQALFVDIQNYADSAQLVNQIQYDKGMSLANALQLEEAKLVFDTLGSFSDSAAQSEKISLYQQAAALEDPVEKYMAFTELGDYLNSMQMAHDAGAEAYGLAQANYENEQFAQASTQFSVLSTYQDAAIYKQLCDIWLAASDNAAENRAGLSAVMAYSEVANIEPVVMNDRFFMIFLEGDWVSSDGGGEMSFEEDTFSAPLLDVAGNDWTFGSRSIYDGDTTVANFGYQSPNEITMTMPESDGIYSYQRVV